MSAFTDLIKSVFNRRGKKTPRVSFTAIFSIFQQILEHNNHVLELMADMGSKLGGGYIFDQQYIRSTSRQIADIVYKLIYNLNNIAPKKYLSLYDTFSSINNDIEEELAGRPVIPQTDYTMAYDLITDDFTDVVGAKNANLAEIKNLLNLTTPEGFAITARAFKSFMEYNKIQFKIDALSERLEQENVSNKNQGEEICDLVLAGTVPKSIQKVIYSSLDQLYRNEKSSENLLALRSSAMGEDREHTFAGQYLSILNEKRENIIQAYKSILASTFSESAMEYRFQKGILDNEEAMAVGCQLMVEAEVSGVLYTLDPRSPEHNMMLITATWGLGAPVVSGEAKVDRYKVERVEPFPLKSMDIVRKVEKLVSKPGGGTEFVSVEEELQTKSCLPDEDMKQLVEAALMIERHFKKPQDIEWAIDKKGQLFILQARPLNIKSQVSQLVCEISSVLEDHLIIFENKGSVAQEGIAAGKVFLMKSEEELDNFPSGAILVTRYTSPRLGKVIRKAGAIITDVGSPTGHMATIAREFRVPTIVDTGVATKILQSGQEITVDARENIIYEGEVKALCYYEFVGETFEETYEYRLLQRVLKKIVPLNLLDPSDKNFTPEGCKTLHDLTRFIHEKAVEELTNLEYTKTADSTSGGRKLKFNIPLDLVLIDIGDGITGSAGLAEVEPDEVISVPMSAFLKGLSAPGAWDTKPMSVDFGSFMSSLTRTLPVSDNRYAGQNLAVLSREYVNINLRLGYHFNMVIAYISKNINDNYAYFRFMGGVTDMTRRSRRARMLAEILSKNDFRIDLSGDLVVARIKKLDIKRMEEKMQIIGLLVAFTRQLDVKLDHENDVDRLIDFFEDLQNKSIKTNMI